MSDAPTEFLTEDEVAFLFSALTAYEQTLRDTAKAAQTPGDRQRCMLDLGHIGTIHKRFRLARLEFELEELATMYRAVSDHRAHVSAALDAGIADSGGQEEAMGFLRLSGDIQRKIRKAFRCLEVDLDTFLSE